MAEPANPRPTRRRTRSRIRTTGRPATQPMTGAQASYLKTLTEEAHTDFDPELSKADASLKIDELQEATGRGN